MQLLKHCLTLLVGRPLLLHKLRHQLVFLEAHAHQQKLLVAQRQLVKLYEVVGWPVLAHNGLQQRLFLSRTYRIGHDFLVQLVEVHQVLVHVNATSMLSRRC